MVELPSRPEVTDLERRWRAIEPKLADASDALARQGSVAARSTPAGVTVFSVRYVAEEDGRRRQRAVYLGASPALADRARALIRRFRAEERWAQETEAAARFATASSALLRRLLAGPGRPPGGSHGARGGRDGLRVSRRGARFRPDRGESGDARRRLVILIRDVDSPAETR